MSPRALLPVLLLLGCPASPDDTGEPVDTSDTSDTESESGPDDSESAETDSGETDDSAPPPPVALIAAGAAHTCTVGLDGTLACRGASPHGAAPPPVISGPIALAAGDEHSAVIDASGAIHLWGDPDAAGDDLTPPEGAFVGVALRLSHACAWTETRAARCWGANTFGQITPPERPLSDLSVGWRHSCGLSFPAAVCWGDNTYGQSAVPADDWSQVSAGALHSCGVTLSGAARCWGDNTHGEATPPPGFLWSEVRAGDGFTCGRLTDGTLRCWGKNDRVQSLPPAGSYAALSVGRTHACARTEAGVARCWGEPSAY